MARNRDRFPRATGMGKGYRREQVDGWLSRVETAMRLTEGTPTVSSAEVRKVGFDLVRRGYDVAAVDAHLDRLEELAVAAEAAADAALGSTGSGHPAVDAERLAGGLARPDGERFARCPLLTRGYDPRDVDAFVAEVLLPGLTGAGTLPPVEQVRSVVFRPRRGGYDEAAVDDALDAVVDHLLRRDRPAGEFVPSFAGARPEPALRRREVAEPAGPEPAAARAATPSSDPSDADDRWAVDGWLPEPHRVPSRRQERDEVPAGPRTSWPEGWTHPGDPAPRPADGAAHDETTRLWSGGLPSQPEEEPRGVDATGPERLSRRGSTGTGWPSS